MLPLPRSSSFLCCSAAIQFYPENAQQLELITTVALKCGFTGGLVVDYPNSTKAKKYFLCLFAGAADAGAANELPAAKGVARSKRGDPPASGAGAAGDMDVDGDSEDGDDDANFDGGMDVEEEGDDDDDDSGSHADDDPDAGTNRNAGKRATNGGLRSAAAAGGLVAAAAGGGGAGSSGALAHETRRVVKKHDRRPDRLHVCVKSRKWVLAKKTAQRARGETVRADTKYTGRKRRPRF